jgi:acetyl-CoA carboxylase carboxyl transferase subunit alpha
MSKVGDAIENALSSMDGLDPAELKRRRRERFLTIGRSLLDG